MTKNLADIQAGENFWIIWGDDKEIPELSGVAITNPYDEGFGLEFKAKNEERGEFTVMINEGDWFFAM